MTWEILGLYLFTRLNSIDNLLNFAFVVLALAYVLMTVGWFVTLDKYSKYEHDIVVKWMKACRSYAIAVTIACLIVPSQKEAMFIIAGTGVVEAAKTDTAQRIASKSVGVVEKYLDEMLAEQTKKEEKK